MSNRKGSNNTKKSGNNSGPRQGGATPEAGSVSTPSRPSVRGVVTNSAPRPSRQEFVQNFQEQNQNLYMTQVQERQGGATQDQFVERTQIQEQRQDRDDNFSDGYEASDRGQDYEENPRDQRRRSIQREDPRESKYQGNTQRLYTHDQYQQELIDRMSSEI